MRPQLGIDASRALVTRRTGTEHYSASLIRALAELPAARDLKASLYVNSSRAEASQMGLGFPLPPLWEVRAIPFPRLWTHVRLSGEMAVRRPGALFVPSHVVPPIHPRNTVVTVHDLGYLEYPQAHTRLSRLYLHLSTMWSARTSRRIIAISEATRRDLIKHYRIPARKIRVVYHGRDTRFHPVTDSAEQRRVAERYGLTGPYCLHVGTIQPRKNLGLLVRVWRQMREQGGEPPQLLLAGRRGWLYEELFREVGASGLGDLVKFADYVDGEDLPTLYSGALLVPFPSLYEGFGLPPLEAMSCGTPVIASNASSIPEVVGDAGILLDPKDTQSWAEAITRLIYDPVLRASMSTKGLERAALFTWERCAEETLAVIAPR